MTPLAIKLEAGSIMFIPAGWICAEMLLNKTQCGGARWLLAPDESLEAYEALKEVLFPTERSKVKVRTTAEMIFKSIEAAKLETPEFSCSFSKKISKQMMLVKTESASV